jgi:glycosyltransferase involved in cell wall biosynthesis
MRPIRILYIRNCRGITHITGAETYLLSLLQGLNLHPFEPLLLCITDPRQGETPWLQELQRRGLPFVTIPISHRLSIRDLLAIPRWIRRFQADLVHSLDHRADVIGITGAKVARKPVLASCFGWTNWEANSARGKLYPWLDRQALWHADTIITDSADMVTQVDGGRGGPPVVVIPNGVDTDEFDPVRVRGTFRRRFSGEEQGIIVGIVARMHPNKGQLEFVKAAAELSRSYGGCRFLMVGDAPPGYEEYKREVLRFIAESGLEKIVLIPQVALGELPEVMASIDILLAPSYIESFSFTLLEAMAMEKPIVATRVGGTPELIIDGETGWLVPPGDWRALSQRVATLIENPEQRARVGRRARWQVEAHWSLKTMVARTVGVYQEVLEWKRQQGRGAYARGQLRERLNESFRSREEGGPTHQIR